MKLFQNNALTETELLVWSNNKLFNPRTNKPIKEGSKVYKYINNQFIIYQNLLECIDNKDPISLNYFWEIKDAIKTRVYPIKDFNKLVFYKDESNLLRCFEEESLSYLKSYNIKTHPITMQEIPDSIFEKIKVIDLEEEKKEYTIKDIAFEVFQYFTKISVFIDSQLFLDLPKSKLLKFNYEIKDFWEHNFSRNQKNEISNKIIFEKISNELDLLDIENIQKYLLSQIKILLLCDKDDFKYMINYIIIGALSVVIPTVKETYPDFAFSF